MTNFVFTLILIKLCYFDADTSNLIHSRARTRAHTQITSKSNWYFRADFWSARDEYAGRLVRKSHKDSANSNIQIVVKVCVRSHTSRTRDKTLPHHSYGLARRASQQRNIINTGRALHTDNERVHITLNWFWSCGGVVVNSVRFSCRACLICLYVCVFFFMFGCIEFERRIVLIVIQFHFIYT